MESITFKTNIANLREIDECQNEEMAVEVRFFKLTPLSIDDITVHQESKPNCMNCYHSKITTDQGLPGYLQMISAFDVFFITIGV